MSIVPASFACDACGKRRDNDVNRWWILLVWTRELPQLRILHFAVDLAENTDAHACGQDCLGKLVQGWAATGSLSE